MKKSNFTVGVKFRVCLVLFFLYPSLYSIDRVQTGGSMLRLFSGCFFSSGTISNYLLLYTDYEFFLENAYSLSAEAVMRSNYADPSSAYLGMAGLVRYYLLMDEFFDVYLMFGIEVGFWLQNLSLSMDIPIGLGFHYWILKNWAVALQAKFYCLEPQKLRSDILLGFSWYLGR